MAYRDPARQRECARRHYQRNKAEYLERNNKKRGEMRAYVQELKARMPCADCKSRFPHYVMDFDHRDDKTKSDIVSRLINQLSWKRLLAEIEKCDLVCANCHRIRTFARLGSTRGRSVAISSPR